jgi:hypothetical protein
MFRLIPESPSWLMVVGKEERALVMLNTVAKINGKGCQVGPYFKLQAIWNVTMLVRPACVATEFLWQLSHDTVPYTTR